MTQFVKLGQFPGGATYVMAMKGDILFTATGPLIEVWKVSPTGIPPTGYMSWSGTNEIVPEKIGELSFEDDDIKGLEIDGNYLYVGNERGLAIVDILNLTNLQIINTYYIESYYRLKIINGLLYASTGYGRKLVILNISDPYNITEIGVFNIPVSKGELKRFTVSGNYAYLPLAFNILEGHIFIVDISNPTNPVEVSHIFLPSSYSGFSAVEVDESRKILFAIEYRKWLRAYDISNILNPVLLGSLGDDDMTSSPLGWASDMEIRGNYAYFSAFYTGINVVDISNPSNMVFLAKGWGTSRLGYVDDILLNSDYAYIANMGGGFCIFNIVNPLNPIYVIQLDTHGIFYDVRVKDNYAYVAADYEFMVFDISDISSLKHISSIEWARSSLGGTKDNYVFITGGWRPLAVVDVSNPNNPVVVKEYSDHTGLEDQNIINNTMYLTKGVLVTGDSPAGRELKIIDISNLPQLNELASYQYLVGPNSAGGLAVKEPYAYAGGDNNGLKILDVSDPANIKEVGQFMVGSRAVSAIIIGNYLYVRSDSYLFTFDISNPVNPVMTSQIKHVALVDGVMTGLHLGGAYGVSRFTAWNNYLVSGSNEGLVMWGISNPPVPTNPVVYSMPSLVGGFDFLGNLFFPAIGYKGIYSYIYGEVDVNPPIISNITSNTTDYYATIEWDTDEITNGVLKYGTSPGIYTKQIIDGYKTHHTINLINLEPSTTYYFIVESKDPSGNLAQSTEQKFITTYSTPGWRDSFEDESKIISKEGVIVGNGNVDLIIPDFRVYPTKDAKISPIAGRSGGTTDLAVGDSDKYRTLLEFTLPSLTAEIAEIKLNLYKYKIGNPTYNHTIDLHLLNNTFDELSSDWTNSATGIPWLSPGGDFDPIVIDHYDSTGSLVEWISFTLKGIDADNSLDSLTWGNTISLILKPSVAGLSYRTDFFEAREGINSPYLEVIPSLVQGSITSEVIFISPVDQYILHSVKILPPNTNITFSLIDASTELEIVKGLSGDYIDVTPYIAGYSLIQIKSTLETTNVAVIPSLQEMKLEYRTIGTCPTPICSFTITPI